MYVLRNAKRATNGSFSARDGNKPEVVDATYGYDICTYKRYFYTSRFDFNLLIPRQKFP